jgi:UrcA family protein
VRYDDLNLSSRAGREALLARIRQAADTVCSALDDGSISALAAYHDCVRDAQDRARAQVKLT